MRQELVTAGLGMLGLASLKWWGDQHIRGAQQKRLLDCAAEHGGWLTRSQALQALSLQEPETEAALQGLVEKGMARRFPGRQGQSVYVFSDWLPTLCAYCQNERHHSGRCSNCGAP